MNHASLFSGIGACELASEWMGWENIFHCEINPFGRQVLNYYWPESISYHDIKTTDFTKHRGTIDVLSGGFPCQPFSSAGKRKGTADDRNLWPEMLRAVREIAPRWVVAENVRGFTNWNGGMVFDQVQADLENEGYECLPFLLPAASVNAPHKRDRIWIIAKNTNSNGRDGFVREKESSIGKLRNTGAGINERLSVVAHSNKNDGGHISRPKAHTRRKAEEIAKTTNPECDGFTTDPASIRQSRQGRAKGQISAKAHENWKASWTYSDDRWPTQHPVRFRNDGIPTELDGITFSDWGKESLMAYGNSMVPQVVLQIFKSIEQYDTLPILHNQARDKL